MTYHLDESPSLGHFTSPFPHFLKISFRHNGPFFRPRDPLQDSSLGKTNDSQNNVKKNYVRIPNCSEFRTEKYKKFLINFQAHQSH